MRNHFLRLSFSLVMLLLASSPPAQLFAQANSDQAKPWYEDLKINGFISGGYSYNFNKPDTAKNRFRVFDFDDNTFKVDVVELSLKKDANDIGSAGFRIDLTAGSSIPQIARSSGMSSGDVDFHQIKASYIAPIGSGLRIDAGKFITHAGYEVIEGYDGYNDNYSRSLLFGYAIPFTHTGVCFGYTFSPSVSAMLLLVNGWDNAIDNNKSKSIGAQLALAPVGGLNLLVNALYGPEKPGNNSDQRSLMDVVATFAISSVISIGVNADVATEQHSSANGGDASWSGFAGYLRINASEKFSLSLRGEMFDDKDGLRTGVVQKLTEITITPEFRATKNFIVRGDFRLDGSDKNVFQKGSDYTGSQSTAALNFLYVF
jgi:hypothetical protein